MKQRIVVGLIATLLGLCAVGQRSQAQTGTFRFDPPASLVARGGSFTISWFDDDQGIDEDGTRSVTWYYAKNADGSDRKRMITLLRDDVTGFRSNWRAIGPFALEWTLRRNRDLGREVLYGPRDAGSLISSDVVQRDVVVSALVRPLDLRNNFALGFRVGPDGRGYELRSEGNKLLVAQPGGDGALAEKQVFEVRPQSWYWYEVGLRSVRKKDLKIRVRVYDAERKRVLTTFDDVVCRPNRRDRDFLEAGMLALTGPADFAELYVDPWKARWCDDSDNRFQWNTADVPDGEYYLIAEICDGRTITTQRSNYRVRVLNRGSADE
jgi:hypothetical protein